MIYTWGSILAFEGARKKGTNWEKKMAQLTKYFKVIHSKNLHFKIAVVTRKIKVHRKL